MITSVTMAMIIVAMEPGTEQIVLVPAYVLTWTVLHEGAHAGAASLSGREVTSFRPYPHVARGAFAMGSTEYTGQRSGFVSVAPYMMDMAIFVASDLAIDNVDESRKFWLVSLMACALVDVAWNYAVAIDGRSQSDFAPWADKRLVVGIGGAAIVLATMRLVDRVREL